MKNQEPEIITLQPRLLVGVHAVTSLAENHTTQLWQQFMPRRNEIHFPLNNDLYSVSLYGAQLQQGTFDAHTKFEKWAARAVTDLHDLPEGMAPLLVSGGLYAKFIHYGTYATFTETIDLIFRQWLPNSNYQLDDRAHFEVMTEKYRGPSDPDSEEEIWIPIKDNN